MPTATYDLLGSSVLGSAANTVTFSGFSSSYSHLILVSEAVSTVDFVQYGVRYNSDGGNNYATVWMSGNGSSSQSTSNTPQNGIYPTAFNLILSDRRNVIVSEVFDANSTTKHKTTLWRQETPGQRTLRLVGRWANNSAITSVTAICLGGGNFAATSTFYLYGLVS